MGNFRHSGAGSSNGQVAMSSGFDAEAAEVSQAQSPRRLQLQPEQAADCMTEAVPETA